MSNLMPVVWRDGDLAELHTATLPALSPSVQYGIGVFDGLMAYWNGSFHNLFEAAVHMRRFVTSARELGLPVAWTDADLVEGCKSLVSELPPTTLYLRPLTCWHSEEIQLTEVPSGQPVTLIAAMRKEERGDRAAVCQISPYQRLSGRAVPLHWKTFGSYVNSYLCRRHAQASGYDDGIMLGPDGSICEASAANVFFLQRDTLVTPALTADIFPGITRQVVLGIARSLGLRIEETRVLPDQVEAFEAVFLAATLMELRAVSRIDAASFRSDAHPAFLAIQQQFRELTRGS
jgi:branched-chain amino acid aminotransferase